ncbi:hypothetical protein H9649_06625 [Sporosarcina sp. Sa2YVA2]|uniref:Late embryogenesis abundant protein LEA-2 subgroup domain-containing protein n=1 Tax=Sporosarcina quadrami TaxID=2762234 RepID=A0ABR8U889_9BACL|nr:hypothetical protein [Sporosarcina quadrami]MBD7984246.1 hypothetical protein [Sporosarcina quadrami]
MKNRLLIILSTVLFVLVGCSSIKEQFNDGNIVFNVVDTESTNEMQAYTIEIINKTGFDLTHLTFNLSYPIKTSNGSKSNPFGIEGKIDNSTVPVNIKSGEATTFSVFAPIAEVFSDTDLLDFENPSVKLKGYFKGENREIPFAVSGYLNVLSNN